MSTDSRSEAVGRPAAWAVPSMREARYSQSLERGLAVLGCFTPSRPVLGIANIASDLGMSRPTTHRYVTTLAQLGYLERDASRKYRLGLRVIDLGMSALNSTGLREHAHPYLQELHRDTNFTVGLGILDGGEIVYVDRVKSSRPGQHKIDLDLHAGSRLPAYCTAMGKLLLGYLPDGEDEAIIGSLELSKHGPNTISSKRALASELEQIRDEGLAVDDEELAPEVQAIAAPVRSEGGEVIAAVNMVGARSTITVDELVVSLSPRLVSTADRISFRLGYRRADEEH